MNKQELLNLLILIFVSACSAIIPDPNRKHIKSKNYSFHINDRVWEETEPDNSDHAYVNPSTGTHLVINSICKKYVKSNLNHLTQNILSGIQNVEISDEKTVSHSNRDAKIVTGKGELDGVLFNFNLFTIKKDRCTYDFVMLSAKSEFQGDEVKSFDGLINSLEFK